MAENPDRLAETKRLMAALGRMPPKQHKDMKVGKATVKKKASPKRADQNNAKG
jgi:hypothetical protein